ncbi:MAG: hypothetical protein AB4058_03570 [Microcystaceae cyanobacterium]
MANIKVNELNPAGSELFSDSESFLNELNAVEQQVIIGGLRPITDTNEECEAASIHALRCY